MQPTHTYLSDQQISEQFLEKVATATSLLSHHVDRLLDDESETRHCELPELMERWWNLLAISTAYSICGGEETALQAIKEAIHHLQRYPFWDGFQLGAALRALCCTIVQLPCDLPEPKLLESGAVPIETEGRWPWAMLPHQLYSAQLGLLWSLLGERCGNSTLSEAAVRVAEWQLNTLDGNYYPIPGLLTREDDFCVSNMLTSNYLLFKTVSLLSQRPQFAYAAERQKQHHVGHQSTAPDLYGCTLAWSVIDYYLNRFTPAAAPSESVSLPIYWTDPTVGLVGYRSPEKTVTLCVSGGGTGLGCLHAKELRILTYGPQLFPLGDCSHFGVLSPCWPHKQCIVEALKGSIAAHGRIAVSGRQLQGRSPGLYRLSSPSGIWIDIHQTYAAGSLAIDTTFYGVTGLDTVAWVYFVRAESCTLPNGHKVRPQSLDRFQGHVEPVTLTHGKETMLLEAPETCAEMHIVPLAGGDSFWGADFLIAYRLNPQAVHYTWRVKT